VEGIQYLCSLDRLKKQTQFAEWAKALKPLIREGLWKYASLCGVGKQSQFLWIPVFTGMTMG